jgi:hypothetical protein
MPIAALAVLLALAAPAPAATSARALVRDCRTGVEAAARRAVFEGRMDALTGAARMQMRFTLQVRTPTDARWETVDAPAFGGWHTAAPGVHRYVFTRRVIELPAPARYRVRVRFRWLDADGATVRRRSATSRTCRQPDLRPDVHPLALGVTWLPAGGARYTLAVANRGESESGPFDVVVTVDGRDQPAETADGLAPGAEDTVVLAGAACTPGLPVTVRIDPDGLVDEAEEADNVLTATCPELH